MLARPWHLAACAIAVPQCNLAVPHLVGKGPLYIHYEKYVIRIKAFCSFSEQPTSLSSDIVVACTVVLAYNNNIVDFHCGEAF